MQAKRRDDETEGHLLQPGEYCCRGFAEDRPYFMACTPDGRLANLSQHRVEQHDDGTITVIPSILVKGGSDDGSWHGYLERDVWRQV